MRLERPPKLRVYWPFNLEGNANSGNHGHVGRPGQVGGSAPGPGGNAKVEASARTIEGELATFQSDPANSRKEISAAINRTTGEIIFRNSIPYEDPENPRAGGVDDAVFYNEMTAAGDENVLHYHTHPDDNAFSDGDWKVLSHSHVGEMRVVTKDHVYTLEKTPKFAASDWKTRYPAKMQERWNELSDTLWDSTYKDMEDAPPSEMVAELTRRINQTMADEFGVIFTVKPRPKDLRDEPVRLVLVLGGAGSGNFDHEGRPGEVGGSGPGKGQGPQLDPKSKETWYRHNEGWNESEGEQPYGWDWPPEGEAYVPPTVAHTVLRMKGRDANSGWWGGSHYGSSVITGDAAKQMGIGGYKDYGASEGSVAVSTRMLEEIAKDTAGSEEPLFHTFENVAGTVFRPGDTMRLPLMASSGKPELGYAHRGSVEAQHGMPVVFAFPKGTPMVGYSTTTKKDLEDLDMPSVEAQHKEQGYIWDEAIVAGGFEVERVETVYMGSQHRDHGIKEGEPIPQLYGLVVHLKPTEVFNPTTGKWTKRG